MKSRLIAGDLEGAETTRAGRSTCRGLSRSPIGRYAAASRTSCSEKTCCLRAGRDAQRSGWLSAAVTESVATLSAGDASGYDAAIRALVADFEARRFLEDTPVADTVLALQALARERGFEAALESPLLPM